MDEKSRTSVIQHKFELSSFASKAARSSTERIFSHKVCGGTEQSSNRGLTVPSVSAGLVQISGGFSGNVLYVDK